MVTTSKLDPSSDNPDRPPYANGQRGSNLTAQLDRPGSFRESTENPILSSIPNITRSSSAVAQGDVVNFFQCLRFDPKVVAAEHRSNRQGDFKRQLNVAIGISTDDGPICPFKGKIPAPEEIKRVKDGLRESTIKARERRKIFNEALSVFNKFFPSVPSKKRSRLEGFPSDRSVMGPSSGKMGMQNHAANGCFEPERQKSEERAKNVVPNKRTRTSLVDVRSNALVRSSGDIDKDREVLKLANSGAVQSDDRTLSIGVDGWEKTKLKKKRSAIKPDVSSSVVSMKPNGGYRESRQGMQQRPVTETRARINSDTHGFAANVCDDSNSSSPTSSTKMNAFIRGPRSGSGIVPRLSPVVHRETTPNEWELSRCSNKPPAAGVNNRKRMASTRSSSPPVAHWSGQRPQKISRAARRTNLIPIVSNIDESLALDTTSDVCVSEPGLEYAKNLTGNSPQQVKFKSDLISSAAQSESEESGVPEIKSKDKGKKSDEMDDKAEHNVVKVSALGMQSWKNKPVAGEDTGHGVRRQGRMGRGFTTRSLMPMSVEKVCNVATAKQLRSARLGLDKTESRIGRPPTRKLSDRKAYKRQKNTMVNAAADFLVGSDDGNEELLAAASAVIYPADACPNTFWRQMESFFGFISDDDISHLKQEGNVESTGPSSKLILSDVNNWSTVYDGYEYIEREGELVFSNETKLSEQLVPGARHIPLYQRLIAAIISQEDYADGLTNLDFDAYETELGVDELGSSGLNHVDDYKFLGNSTFSNHKMTGKKEHDKSEALGFLYVGMNSNFNYTINGLLLDQALVPGIVSTDTQFDDEQTNERLLLELQSVGIYPESLLEDEAIGRDVSSLENMYRVQVSKKKAMLDTPLKSASAINERQEKEFEQRAHDRLVAMAYEKYMAYWGRSASVGKSSGNKMAKQAALSFVRRTLERCHKYEDTGKSCFGEPLFRDMFLSRSSDLNSRQLLGAPVDGEPRKIYANASNHPLEARIAASTGPQLSPVNCLSEQFTGKEDNYPNRVKKRELPLEDVGGIMGTSNAPSGIGVSLSTSTKGKRSERDREGKVLSRKGTNKIGRPALSHVKGDRKSKTKPKQKTQLSVSVNGLLSKMSEQPNPSLPSESKSAEIINSNDAKEKDGLSLDALDDSEAIDISSLQLPGLDDSQGQDLGSWLNIDDDGLHDHDDFMGLEIPMDDLSDLNMML